MRNLLSVEPVASIEPVGEKSRVRTGKGCPRHGAQQFSFSHTPQAHGVIDGTRGDQTTIW